MNLASVISLLGGLAFFLFGMSLMGDSMKKVAGNKLETILGRLTSNRVKGILLGTVVTAVIQSSSATTVMVVGFVNSGLMKLGQAIGIIMGANIGTTATGWILTLAGIDEGSGAASLLSTTTIFALVALIGIILEMFAKFARMKNVGVLLLAFSVLMSGMKTMSAAVAPLQQDPNFLNAITVVSNPLLGVVIGTVFTAIIQSNSAAVGILQALAITGVITFDTAVPLVLGMNIGACAPVLLSAIGANKNGKRTAIIYLYYNFVGTVVFMAVLYGVNAVVGLPFFGTTVSDVGVAVINTVFNTVATLVLTPFIGLLEKMACLTFPSTEEDEEFEENLLDERFLAYPPLAVEQSARTVTQMATAARKNLNKSLDLLEKFDKLKYDKIMSREDLVDRLEDRLGNYLVKLNTRELSDEQTRQTSKFLHALTNLERISDHAVNLADLGAEMNAKGLSFTPQADRELSVCMNAVREVVDLAYEAINTDSVEAASRVEPLEEVIDILTEELKLRHINRLQAGQCTLEMGFIFNDCVNNFERVADHCSNLAISVLELGDTSIEAHDYLRTLKQEDPAGYHQQMLAFEEKYRLPPRAEEGGEAVPAAAAAKG